MKKVRVGMVGLGDRGRCLLKDAIVPNPKAEVVAVCDEWQEGVNLSLDIIREATGKEAYSTNDYKEFLKRDDIDLVLVCGSHETHIPYAIAAVEAGKKVAIEVGGAYSIQQCWDLVHASERTGLPIMLLENCCFGKRELMIKNMVELGVFGEIVHCDGGYMHDLRDILWRYRIRNYSKRNCDNYPTHDLGPIAQILGINRGNRMVSLVSVASKASGYADYLSRRNEEDEVRANAKLTQADIITTVIKCANGETITLQLDTTLPRAYSRNFTVRGTKGMYREDNDSIFLDGDPHEDPDKVRDFWGNADKYEEKYLDPIWKKFLAEGVKGTHGGMDWLLFDNLFDCCIEDKPFCIDVYDTASWMAITALSEQSIALGGAPVYIPDFTNGQWMWRK